MVNNLVDKRVDYLVQYSVVQLVQHWVEMKAGRKDMMLVQWSVEWMAVYLVDKMVGERVVDLDNLKVEYLAGMMDMQMD